MENGVLKESLRLARIGQPIGAACLLGWNGYSARSLAVIARYPHHSGHTVPIKDLLEFYWQEKFDEHRPNWRY